MQVLPLLLPGVVRPHARALHACGRMAGAGAVQPACVAAGQRAAVRPAVAGGGVLAVGVAGAVLPPVVRGCWGVRGGVLGWVGVVNREPGKSLKMRAAGWSVIDGRKVMGESASSCQCLPLDADG